MRFVLLASVATFLACGGKTTAPLDDAATDAATSDAVADTAASDAASTETAIDAGPTCFNPDQSVPIMPFKLCQSDTDCIMMAHQTDCCGNTTTVGVNKAHYEAFKTCEDASRAMFPPCGCPTGPARTEDGESPAFPLVHCTDFTSSGGVCRSYAM